MNTQKELYNWMMKNFGKGVSKEQLIHQQLAGMIEELGELTHSLLKKEQSIRLDENHDENIEDAIGDIMIYGCNFLSLVHINMDEIILTSGNVGNKIYKYENNTLLAVFDINIIITALIQRPNNYSIYYIIGNFKKLFEILESIIEEVDENGIITKTSFDIFKKISHKILERNWNEHRKQHNQD